MSIKIHKVKIDRIGVVDISTMVFLVVMYRYESVVLEKTLESPLNSKESQPVHSKGNQSWLFFGRTDAKAETPVLWPPHAKS